MVNPGYKAGIKQHTKAERLAWAWKGAQKNAVERRLNPMQAVIEARKLSESLGDKLAAKQINRKDVGVYLVFAEQGDLGKLAGTPVLFKSQDPSADSSDLTTVRDHFKHVPIGYLVAVLNRKGKKFIVHARPLRLEDSALRLLESLVTETSKLKDWRVN
ncbi:MAG: hypothetical protein DMG96_23270 [Acidobacteria bacterium]|nr:MAG: hypothetical protein DMG96_23270 [Acidobacteriota bacterium]